MTTVQNRFEVGIEGLMMDGCFRTYNEAKRHAIYLASQNPGYRGYVYDRMARITCRELSIFDSAGQLCEFHFRMKAEAVPTHDQQVDAMHEMDAWQAMAKEVTS